MKSKISPKPGILEIEPYVGGESAVKEGGPVYKLSSNENPLGPSEKAKAAYHEVAGQLERYPSSDHAALRNAIASVHGVDASRVICGDGSDEVISWLCFAYSGIGDEVLYTEHGFSMYHICALAAGATPVVAGETDRRVDVDKILAACTERTRIVFVTNPGNPTGTMVPMEEIERLAKGLPPQALMVLDGAYAEYVEGYDAGLALIESRENVVMTRTFSKIYGLGGLRVGWGYGPACVIDVLNRLRGPFNVTAGGLAAAESAVLDGAHMFYCRAENAKWRDWMQAKLAAIGLPSDPSHTNFILPRFASEAQADAADACLRNNGLIIRAVKGYGLPHCLRITVGDEQTCRLLVAVVTEFMKGQA